MCRTRKLIVVLEIHEGDRSVATLSDVATYIHAMLRHGDELERLNEETYSLREPRVFEVEAFTADPAACLKEGEP